MINIGIVRDKDGFIWEFTVKGHAGFSERGSDVVCAAVSAIAQTTLGALEELAGIKTFTIRSGNVKCHIPLEVSNEEKLKIKIILETMVIGFKQIKCTPSYKKYITILDEEV